MQEESATQVQQNVPETQNAKHFAELRRIAEAARNENAQLKNYVAQLEEKMNSLKPVEKQDDDVDEPYVDHKRFQKEMENFDKRIEKKIDEIAEKKARLLLAEEKKNEYLRNNADFNEVMKPEVLESFIQQNPSIADALQKMPDTFERQQLVYETVKKLKSFESKKAAPEVPKSPLVVALEARKPQMAYQPGNVAPGAFASIGDFSEGGMKNAYERFKALQKTFSP